ncbi:transcriptional regulator [Streptomyces sp. NBC_00289]|uniref:transcriptional regulator n=1 Tax=Streptomyces sp. NBC_00289 TaxID=2975703 RepID=UPI00324A6641
MTTVRTTPPPRLPVRDKAAAQDRGWGGVSPMLTRLAAERATGVLVRERGTLHLAEGQVVHAESPSAPALDVLLSTRGTLHAHTDTTAGPTAGLTVDTTTEAGPRRSVPGAGGRHRDGRVPVDGGRPTPGALELCHLVALYDAAYFALAPSSTPGRFRYGTAEGPGAVRPVPVDALERETLRRRDLLHRIWPDPRTDGIPLVRAEAVAAPALTARRRAVLALVDGVRTASDIARELGRPAFHTLVDVRRLVAAGVVAPGPQTPVVPLPPELAGGGDPGHTDDPNITLLKRLRDALEAL